MIIVAGLTSSAGQGGQITHRPRLSYFQRKSNASPGCGSFLAAADSALEAGSGR